MRKWSMKTSAIVKLVSWGNVRRKGVRWIAPIASALVAAGANSSADDRWIVYQGAEGPGFGKHLVLVAGDEEYRSEEALPQLGKILADRHGFRCTVLLAIDPETGFVDPNQQENIPGLEALRDADLLIIATRRRNLPDRQMAEIDAYLRSGKPVLGMRTATHAFKIPSDRTYAHYSDGYDGTDVDWQGGFGQVVLGSPWIAHHGHHKHEATRGVVPQTARRHPIVRGLGEGDIWGPTDVYRVPAPLPTGSEVLVLGQVTERMRSYDDRDRWFGMRPTDPPLAGEKNDPMMPVAWVKPYQISGGRRGMAFATTMGAATDLESLGTRRMVVNAVYFLLGVEVPAEGANVDLVGDYNASPYGFHERDYFLKKKLRPADCAVPVNH